MSELQQLDAILSQYYTAMGKTDYYDDNKQGKLIKFLVDTQWNYDTIPIEVELGPYGDPHYCSLIKFDDNFPISNEIKVTSKSQFEEIVFWVLQYCYNNNAPPTTQQIKDAIFSSWKKILINYDKDIIIDSDIITNNDIGNIINYIKLTYNCDIKTINEYNKELIINAICNVFTINKLNELINYLKQFDYSSNITTNSNKSVSKKYIYAIGPNMNYEFGLNHNDKVSELTLIDNQYNITNINCGKTMIVYSDNNNQNIYVSGHNKQGQCGLGHIKGDVNNESIHTLTDIKYFQLNNKTIHKICPSITGDCTFWIDNQHRLYGNGYNYYKPLGLSNNNNNIIYSPSLINQLYNVIEVASASKYSIALCSINIYLIIVNICKIRSIIQNIPDDIFNLIESFYSNPNKVYSTSYSWFGGNGRANNHSSSKWYLIETLKNIKIIKISVGRSHSLFLDSNYNVWGCGRNHIGQLGIQSDYVKQTEPMIIPYFKKHQIKIKDIVSGEVHNLAISIDNKVFSWGSNKYGQCGHWCSSETLYIPQMIPCFIARNVKSISCGDYHSYICTKENQHYLFGDNEYNQCIINHDKDEIELPNTPSINLYIQNKYTNKTINKVCPGSRCTLLILSDK